MCRATEPNLDIKEIISNRTASLDRSKVLRLECAAENPEGAPGLPPLSAFVFCASPVHFAPLPRQAYCALSPAMCGAHFMEPSAERLKVDSLIDFLDGLKQRIHRLSSGIAVDFRHSLGDHRGFQ